MPHDYEKYHTHHASRRLRGCDYTRSAAYFVTICTKDRICLFGEIIDGQMRLNEIGRIVEEEWRQSEALRDEVTLDAFVVMPNHLHGIVVIGADGEVDPHGYRIPRGVGASPPVAPTGRSALHQNQPLPTGPPPKSLGAFIAGYKAAATTRINALHGMPGAKVWQPRYHDRILRDEDEWRRCRQYIAANPARWDEDRNHPTRL